MKPKVRLAGSAGVATLFTLLGGALQPAAAQTPLPVGPQALANVTTTGHQDESAVAIDPNGNFVVVWRDEFLDGSASAIVGRRFHARTGLPLSGEFLVNFSSTGEQRNPAIAVANDGHFVVVWEGPDNIDPPITPGIFGRLFAADGTPLTPDFPVNTDHAGLQRRPAVAMQPSGAFAVAWQDDTPPNFALGGSGDNIRGRFYPADFPASPASDPLFLNVGMDGDQEEPAVTAVPGGWLVAWQGPRQFSPVIPLILVRGIDFSGNGTLEFEANTSNTVVQRAHVALAANGQGDAVVVWEAEESAGETRRDILARRIVDGTPSVGEEPISLSPGLDDREPSVAIDQQGAFVTVWVSAPPLDPPFEAAPEGSPIVILGRKKNGGSGLAEGSDPLVPPSDSEFLVNTSGTDFIDPWVANEPRGNFVVAWQGVDAADSQGNGVLYRGFRDAIFADDFETQNTSRWSDVVP
jgi:hypothetical protein